MTVYADTPRWHRHGTLWGHLISDRSLEELHEVAAEVGLHPRSFDLDHYDWPGEAAERLAAAGVVRVGNAELTRLLIRGGLRIPAKDRPARHAERTRAHAALLGLPAAQTPTHLLLGMRGHVPELLPPPAGDSFRLMRDLTAPPPATLDLAAQDLAAWPVGSEDLAPWRIIAGTQVAQERAEALAAVLDAAAERRGAAGFVGQALARD